MKVISLLGVGAATIATASAQFPDMPGMDLDICKMIKAGQGAELESNPLLSSSMGQIGDFDGKLDISDELVSNALKSVQEALKDKDKMVPIFKNDLSVKNSGSVCKMGIETSFSGSGTFGNSFSSVGNTAFSFLGNCGGQSDISADIYGPGGFQSQFEMKIDGNELMCSGTDCKCFSSNFGMRYEFNVDSKKFKKYIEKMMDGNPLVSGIDCFDDILDLFLESFKNVDGKYSMKLKAYGCANPNIPSGEYDDLLLKSVLDLANANMDQMEQLGISFKLDYKANVVIADAASSENIIKGGSTIKFKSGDSEVQGKILEVAQAADANGNVEITVEGADGTPIKIFADDITDASTIQDAPDTGIGGSNSGNAQAPSILLSAVLATMAFLRLA